MNQINLIGRITKKPELRYTKSEKAVCEFSLAVNRIGQDEADFINCSVWGKQAENLCKYQDKGSLIALDGTLRVDTYEVEGQKRYKTYVLANNIEYLSSKSSENVNKESDTQSDTQQEPVEEDPFKSFGEQVETDFTDDDLPF